MTPPTTFVAAAVRALRGHGGRPATDVPGGPTWADLAAEGRALALGLRAAGVGAGWAVHVSPPSAGPATQVGREVAVLSTGAALALPAPTDDRAGFAVLDDGGLVLDGERTSLERLIGPSSERDGAPDAYEDAVAGLGPDDAAVVCDGRLVTHGELLWAHRTVDRWLLPVVGPWGPGRVLSVSDGPQDAPLTAALVGRWWPALAGAELITAPGAGGGARAAGGLPALVGPAGLIDRADMVVADPRSWGAVAAAGRGQATRSRRGRALLRDGRVAAAGEPRTRGERAASKVLARRTGPAVREAAGLGRMAVGISLGPPDLADARDLAALGVPVVPTWVDRSVPAPVAAGAVVHPSPAGRWGRPLPGRSIECGGPTTTVSGGDVPGEAIDLSVHTAADGRDRVQLR